MTRRAYDKKLVERAKDLRSKGWPYSAIARKIYAEYGESVSLYTIRDWVTYYSRGA